MEQTLMVLDKINTPEDLRGLSAEEMNLLSAEIRDLILKKGKHNRRASGAEFRHGRGNNCTSQGV